MPMRNSENETMRGIMLAKPPWMLTTRGAGTCIRTSRTSCAVTLVGSSARIRSSSSCGNRNADASRSVRFDAPLPARGRGDGSSRSWPTKPLRRVLRCRRDRVSRGHFQSGQFIKETSAASFHILRRIYGGAITQTDVRSITDRGHREDEWCGRTCRNPAEIIQWADLRLWRPEEIEVQIRDAAPEGIVL